MCLALKLLTPLRWGSNPMRGSCQLLTKGCWFIPRKNVLLQLWKAGKLTAIYNQSWLKNGIKLQLTSPHILTKCQTLLKFKFKIATIPYYMYEHFFSNYMLETQNDNKWLNTFKEAQDQSLWKHTNRELT